MELLWSLFETLVGILLIVGILWLVVAFVLGRVSRRSISRMLKTHFAPVPPERLAVHERLFPVQIRADLQQAVEQFLAPTTLRTFVGVPGESSFHGGINLAPLVHQTPGDLLNSTNACPPQYEEIDVGEDQPARTLKAGLWLGKREGTKYAILYAPHFSMGACGYSQRMRLQVVTLNEEPGTELTRQLFRHMETSILSARSYRGKVLSFEEGDSYFGQATGVKVHRLGGVPRDEVILPRKTLDLLDRNVLRFVASRDRLGQVRMATKKGLLFYGPPGTGKTHTIRYLAGALEGHTMFLIAAEQVGLLSEYMTLGRLLQPSIIVIEDVDLIARDRVEIHDIKTEALLNKLLNEMDGLRADAHILFILTTNRPEELERALASRPGRIDQAIEFPLPDDEGRARLVELYARGVDLAEGLKEEIVRRTERVSGAFIKELMRRSVQFQLERDGSGPLQPGDVRNALEEMLVSGGSLNLKLLGAASP